MEDVGFRSGGEGCDIGEPAEPFVVIRDDSSDLGLLEHELRDEDRVGIDGSAPRKIARVFTVPRKESAPERGAVDSIHVDDEVRSAAEQVRK